MAFRVAFTGGGTGGHIYPALAIDDAIRAEYDAAHYEPRFFGNRHGLEATLVTSMPIAFVPSAALQRRLSFGTLLTLWRNALGIAIAAVLLAAAAIYLERSCQVPENPQAGAGGRA